MILLYQNTGKRSASTLVSDFSSTSSSDSSSDSSSVSLCISHSWQSPFLVSAHPQIMHSSGYSASDSLHVGHVSNGSSSRALSHTVRNRQGNRILTDFPQKIRNQDINYLILYDFIKDLYVHFILVRQFSIVQL